MRQKSYLSLLSLLALGLSSPVLASPEIDYGADGANPPADVCDADKVWEAAQSMFFAPPVDLQIRGVTQRVPLQPEANPNIGLWGVTRVNTDGSPRFHAGIDILGDEGEAVLAPIDGTIRSGNIGGLGNYIDLDFQVGVLSPPALCDVHLRFAHLSQITVGSGAVSAGAEIGRIGRTGNAIGQAIPTHVHLEFWAIPQTVKGQNRAQSTRDALALFGW